MNRTLDEYRAECHKIARDKGFWDGDCGFCKGAGSLAGEGEYELDRKCVACQGTGQTFYQRNTGELLMLIVSELGEALEAHRKRKFAEVESYLANQKAATVMLDEREQRLALIDHFQMFIKDSYEDEIADVFIRLMDLCGGQEIDLEFFVTEKMKYNATRERLHGKAY